MQHFLGAIGGGAGGDDVAGVIRAGRSRAFVGEGDSAAAGVADGDVDPAEAVHDFVDGAEVGVAVCQVCLEADGPDAEGLAFGHDGVGGQRGLLEFVDFGRLQVAVDDGDVGGEAREAECVGAAEAAGAAGDEGHFACEFLGHGRCLMGWAR